MWSELETLVRMHSGTSEMHGKVLECLLECKKPSDEKRRTEKGKEELSEVESAWKDLDRFGNIFVGKIFEAHRMTQY